MVGCNNINRAVFNTLNKSIHILSASKRRIHFKPAVLLQILVTHSQIMRACFTRNFNPTSLSLTDNINAFLS